MRRCVFQPLRPQPDRHHLNSGLASYREASSVSVDSRGKVTMLALEMFGKPARTYHYRVYTIVVWNKNLLGELNCI